MTIWAFIALAWGSNIKWVAVQTLRLRGFVVGAKVVEPIEVFVLAGHYNKTTMITEFRESK